MSRKNAVAAPLKEKKVKLQEEISFLKKTITDYKAERKAHWKLFKNKVNEDIGKLKKTVDELPGRSKK